VCRCTPPSNPDSAPSSGRLFFRTPRSTSPIEPESLQIEEEQILSAIRPGVDLSITDAGSVWDGNLNCLLLPETAPSIDFHLLGERHPIVGWLHLRIVHNPLAEHPHSRLRVMNAIPEQHPGSEGEGPVSKAVHARHAPFLGLSEAVTGDELQILLHELPNQTGNFLTGVGAVGVHGYDDFTGCHCEAGAVGAPVALARLEVDRCPLLFSEFPGSVTRVSVYDEEIQLFTPAVVSDAANRVDDGSLLVASRYHDRHMNRQNLCHSIPGGCDPATSLERLHRLDRVGIA